MVSERKRCADARREDLAAIVERVKSKDNKVERRRVEVVYG